MSVSLEMPAQIYPYPGRYTFCLKIFPLDEMTNEHIIARAISCVGEIEIENGSCKTCNNDANQRYELAALSTDFNIARIIGAETAPSRKEVKTASRLATQLWAQGILILICRGRNIPISSRLLCSNLRRAPK